MSYLLNNFFSNFITNLLIAIYTILWCLLLIVPGIIKCYSYSMTFFVRADQPGVGAGAAIKRSMELMKGFKWKLFCLYCRFIGWALLSILTVGIGFLWLIPYINISVAGFYEDVKGRAAIRGV